MNLRNPRAPAPGVDDVNADVDVEAADESRLMIPSMMRKGDHAMLRDVEVRSDRDGPDADAGFASDGEGEDGSLSGT